LENTFHTRLISLAIIYKIKFHLLMWLFITIEERVCKIKDKFQLKERRRKIHESLMDCDGTLKDGSSLFLSSNEFTTFHFTRI